MKRQTILILLLAVIFLPARSLEPEQVKPVKNLILLIPDGTSLATVSAARWYQWYLHPDKPKLFIDPFLCGTVLTHSSNNPIGDSAPTTSCFMTGYPSRAGFVATCQVPHATPADCAAHSYNRSRYEWIAPQMVHNDLDVVIGGGVSLLSEADEVYLKANGYGVYKDDIEGMRSYTGAKMWALYNTLDMAYDLDRDPVKEPSIEEMTRTAIQKLSTNENGFFLMVEGSKVDWAAHANDPAAMITEFLAFDRACGAALEFARQNGETVVVVVPDHGNSGFSIGNRNCGSRATKDEIFQLISQVKLTAEGFAKKLNSEPATAVQQIFREYAGFELTDAELQTLYQCKNYVNSPIPEGERKEDAGLASLYSSSLNGFIAKLITSKTCFGFTTGGHTGEEVFLAGYHPAGTPPIGMNTNIELNRYMAAALGVNGKLDELTAQYFAPHTEVFGDCTYEIVPSAEEKGSPTLVVRHAKDKKKQLTVTPNTNIVKLGRKGETEVKLQSVVVYVDVNNTFYLPRSLAEYLK